MFRSIAQAPEAQFAQAASLKVVSKELRTGLALILPSTGKLQRQYFNKYYTPY